MDFLTFLMFLVTMVIMVATSDNSPNQQPFVIIYIYLQFMVLYMTFRARYCQVQNLNLLYRIHVFNFLYSLFTLATGYVELTRAIIAGGSLLEGKVGLFIFEVFSLISAHVVLGVYLCCPYLSFSAAIR